MNKCLTPIFSLSLLLMGGCQLFNYPSKEGTDSEIVAERYIHKYGYDVSKKEWESAGYPGQVVTLLKNGITITTSYENGALHGKSTRTYPYSQTIASSSLYERGTLVQKTAYNVRGFPEREERLFSPTHVQVLRWYSNGTPLSREEYFEGKLLEGEYYDRNNERESLVTKGAGTRLVRGQRDEILQREKIDQGAPIQVETFHPHGTLRTITQLLEGKIYGEKMVYASSGEPISSEHYRNDTLHGRAIYYQNGRRHCEVHYKNGLKNGLERYFCDDGNALLEETEWMDGEKHGLSTIYFDGMSKEFWYYNGTPVSKSRYRELQAQEKKIARANDRSAK